MANEIQRISRRLSQILGSSTPWIFLLSAVSLGLLTNGLSTWITESADNGMAGGAITTLIGALLLALSVAFFNLPRRLREWLARINRSRATMTMISSVPPRRGLIALVSPGPGGSPQTRLAIEFYMKQDSLQDQLNHCWLIVGPGEGEDSSTENAEKLKASFEPQGVKIDIIPLSSSEDPKEVFEAVKQIYSATLQNIPLRPEEVIADFTAGTKSMSTGMALACSTHGWGMQFMRPEKYDSQGRATRDAKAIPVIVTIDFLSEPTKDTSP